MNGFVKDIARIGYHQLKNGVHILRREPVMIPSLVSMTLDDDDLKVAQKWLGDRTRWQEKTIVAQFEARFAEWNGSKYAFGFMGGRVALSAIIYALNLQPDDEVLIPGYTCVVVPNAFRYASVKLVYCDIELETYGLDANQLESHITDQTKAILLHHLYGLVCRDYEKILAIAHKYSLPVIEDCAHSTGAEYKGKKVGNWGQLAFYSTEQSKVLNTIQGGVAVTNETVYADRLQDFVTSISDPDIEMIEKLLHNVALNYKLHKDRHRWWRADLIRLKNRHQLLISTTKEEEKGIKPAYYGCRMPAPIAALGLNQLDKINQYNMIRRNTAHQWDLWCEENNYQKPLVLPDSIPVFLRYPVLVESQKKENLAWGRKQLQVELGVWFKTNIHPVPSKIDGCPNANIAVKQCINFPTILQ